MAATLHRMSEQRAVVRDNPEERQFEVLVEGVRAGLARYVRRPGRLVFVHTEVDPAYSGQGVGSVLAAGALDAARAEGVRVLPLCPFIEGFIAKHPEYADLVDTELLARFDAPLS